MGIATFPASSGGGLTTAQPVWNLIGYNACTDSATTRTISNIPQTYSTLKVIVSGLRRPDADWWAWIRLNANADGVYSDGVLNQGEAPGPSARQSGGYNLASGIGLGQQNGDQVRSGNYGYFEVNIYNYSNASLQEKPYEYTISFQAAYLNTGWQSNGSGLYRPSSAAAITSIALNTSHIDVVNPSANSSRGFFVFGSN